MEVTSSENTSPGWAMRMPVMARPNAFAQQVAFKVMKHARDIKYLNEHKMWCPDCRLYPVLPVTGQCGHTRCTVCIEKNGRCPCGFQSPLSLHHNILIQDLLTKMLPGETSRPASAFSGVTTTVDQLQAPPAAMRGFKGPERVRRRSRLLHYSSAVPKPEVQWRQPISLQERYTYAQDLLASGQYWEAAPHLAHVAASSEPFAKRAKLMLAQAISALSDTRDPRRIMRDLYRTVREHTSVAWLKPSDLECIICYQVLRHPVTTPCGHTFCRACIERTMEFSKRCALCSQSLDNFEVAQTADTSFISTALAAINALIPPSVLDPDFIPIFACTVAFPSIPCPLLIFDPHYWTMIRRVLESGSRKFGMVAYLKNGTFASSGTIVEVRDCVQFEDGRSILSTVGITRFKVIERDIRDGCHMARIQELKDIPPNLRLVVQDLHKLAQHISYKAVKWLTSLDRQLLADIKTAFGDIPQFEDEVDWWENPDGPTWLWWLIAILPLRSEIQLLMLATKHLPKRMLAVSRTLDIMRNIEMTPVIDSFEIENEIYFM